MLLQLVLTDSSGGNCMQRGSTGCYDGNEKARQSVELRFGDFVDYYQAAYNKQSHWLQTVDDLEFYLAQCPIAVSMEAQQLSIEGSGLRFLALEWGL
ncbi:hypothetical protein P3T76_000505 [Phytophthora citrophthora]|uniref:Uncharacterized protein n=1 Tax=Phytophthora citrophthora TaxID=4793 RepID=A0AAD9LSE5_9STRA|nr:hypothetical protein P3T76_000505 [Phytophthora citrophthora]